MFREILRASEACGLLTTGKQIDSRAPSSRIRLVPNFHHPKMTSEPPKETPTAFTASKPETGSGEGTTYSGMATSAATNAASSAASTAQGVKDSVFSMFGGGAKKEEDKSKDPEEEQDRSGSAKAVKEAKEKKEGEDGEGEGVRCPCIR